MGVPTAQPVMTPASTSYLSPCSVATRRVRDRFLRPTFERPVESSNIRFRGRVRFARRIETGSDTFRRPRSTGRESNQAFRLAAADNAVSSLLAVRFGNHGALAFPPAIL